MSSRSAPSASAVKPQMTDTQLHILPVTAFAEKLKPFFDNIGPKQTASQLNKKLEIMQ
jgi:hypothetical protein